MLAIPSDIVAGWAALAGPAVAMIIIGGIGLPNSCRVKNRLSPLFATPTRYGDGGGLIISVMALWKYRSESPVDPLKILMCASPFAFEDAW